MLKVSKATEQLSKPPDRGKKNPRAFDFLSMSQRKAEG